MNYAHLNVYIPPDSGGYSDAWSRVLGRLGDYTAIIIRELNMRPHEVVLLAQTPAHVLVRISHPGEHLVLRIAPEGHLLSEIFFSRSTRANQIPAARLIRHDTQRMLVPFDYTLERYVCGVGVDQIDAPHLIYAAARQAGRLLRRVHRVPVAGWGHPTTTGRWRYPDWQGALFDLHERLAPLSLAGLIFTEEEQAAVAALLEHPALLEGEPRLMHGAVGPQAVRCTIGEHVQLEALVDPGAIVAGDGLLDLAQGLDPAYPAPWRRGLLDGYKSLTTLNAAEGERLRLLHLLTSYWSACQRYGRAEPHEAACAQVRGMLAAAPLPYTDPTT
jgi:hypothetical protein